MKLLGFWWATHGFLPTFSCTFGSVSGKIETLDCKEEIMEEESYSEIDDTVVQFGVLIDSGSAFLNKGEKKEKKKI